MNAFLVKDPEPVPGIPNRPFLAIDPGAGAPSRVCSEIRIHGDIFGKQDLLVDGEVDGSLTFPENTLTIGPNAKVKAHIKAQNVVLVGSVEGKIEVTERIELRSHCNVLGDIRTPRIMIENGAYVKGTIEVVR